MLKIIQAKYKGKIYECLVDEEDYEEVKKYKWYVDKYGYAYTGRDQGNIKMHQLVLGKKEGYVIDHINHNKLDNRRSNLRHLTRQANAMRMQKERGIYWRESTQKWIVQIKINGKIKHIGVYSDKDEARKARKNAEEKYFRQIIEEC